MKPLPEEIIQFFHKQGFVIVSTFDKKGTLHNSCKGIVDINVKGELFLLDVYRGQTHANLREDNRISVCGVDEHLFKGYCLKGTAGIISLDAIPLDLIGAWEEKIASRITRRLLKNIREEKGQEEKGRPRHPEALLPKPTYMIAMQVKELVDLTPQHLKE